MNSYGPKAISTQTSTAHAGFAVTLPTASLPDYRCLYYSPWGAPLVPLLPQACRRSLVTKRPANLEDRRAITVSRGHSHRETLALVELRRGTRPRAAHLGGGCPVTCFQVSTTRTRVLTGERLDLIAEVVVRGAPTRPEKAIE